MATVKNVDRKLRPIALTGGKTLSHGEEAGGVDVTAENEAAWIATGSLLVTDGTSEPPAPDTTFVKIIGVAPEWDAGHYFPAGVCSRQGGSTYVALVGNVNKKPSEHPEDWYQLDVAGTTGAPGTDGRTVRSGSGAPSSGLGVEGDFYIEVTGGVAAAIYGPKVGGSWGSPTPMTAPPVSASTTVAGVAKLSKAPTSAENPIALAATEKGANGGLATLDESGKLPSGQLPAGAATKTEVSSAITTAEAASDAAGTAAADVTTETTARVAADALLIPLSQKGAANGVASLDAGGVLPTAQLPPLSLTDAYVVHSEAEQLALTVHKGDVAVRTDLNKSYMQNGGVAGTMADWTELPSTGEVQSVNGHTGTVALTAADVAAIPTSAKAAASGVGSLDSEGHQVLSQVPPSVVSGSAAGATAVQPAALTAAEEAALTPVVLAVAEVEGAIEPAIPAGKRLSVFPYSLKGTAILKPPTGALAGFNEVSVRVAIKGHTFSTSGIKWNGGEPVWPPGAEAVVRITMITEDGGTTWEAQGVEKGEKGTTGATGATGLGVLPVLMPILAGGVPGVVTGVAIGTAFKAAFLRCVVPNSGHLKKIYLPIGNTQGGETRTAVFDTGDAEAGHYTCLWEGSAIKYTEAGWKSAGVPELAVTAGQHIMVAFMNSEVTGQYGFTYKALLAAFEELPSTFLPVAGGAAPKLAGAHTYGSLSFGGVGAKITEAELTAGGTAFVPIGTIS